MHTTSTASTSVQDHHLRLMGSPLETITECGSPRPQQQALPEMRQEDAAQEGGTVEEQHPNQEEKPRETADDLLMQHANNGYETALHLSRVDQEKAGNDELDPHKVTHDSTSNANEQKSVENADTPSRCPTDEKYTFPRYYRQLSKIIRRAAPQDPDLKWHIGIKPVDMYGSPLQNMKWTGGWLATFFILGNNMAEKMALFFIATNFSTFLVYKMHLGFSERSNVITNFMGTSELLSLVGGLVADSYLGRFWTIGISTFVHLLGLLMLTSLAIAASLKPSQVGCTNAQALASQCKPASDAQVAFMYASLYVTAVGMAGIRANVAPFGADQFDESIAKEKGKLPFYFNTYFVFYAAGMTTALTGIVFIQEKYGWEWGLGGLAIFATLMMLIFLTGTPLYRHKLASGNSITRAAQVVVASLRNWNVEVPGDRNLLYEVHDKESAIVGSRKLEHTPQLRFLDKAAVITNAEVSSNLDKCFSNPWRLCTVTQIEELKTIIKIAPVWGSTILLGTVYAQILNFSVQQGLTLRRKVGGHFTIPAASMAVFLPVAVIFWLFLYENAYVPLLRRLTGHPRGMTSMQRIGTGLAISIIALIVAGAVEHKRLNIAVKHGLKHNGSGEVPMSVFWLTAQYSLIGLVQVFTWIGMLEFFYEQAPDSMKSLGISLVSAANGLGCLNGTLLVNRMNKLAESKRKEAWLGENMNKGHLDYYYWVLALLSMINFHVFLLVSQFYRHRRVSQSVEAFNEQPI